MENFSEISRKQPPPLALGAKGLYIGPAGKEFYGINGSRRSNFHGFSYVGKLYREVLELQINQQLTIPSIRSAITDRDDKRLVHGLVGTTRLIVRLDARFNEEMLKVGEHYAIIFVDYDLEGCCWYSPEVVIVGMDKYAEKKTFAMEVLLTAFVEDGKNCLLRGTLPGKQLIEKDSKEGRNMTFKQLPDYWRDRLNREFRRKNRPEETPLRVKDFEDTVRINFEDGSMVIFEYAFFLRDEEHGEIGVFTEHCGYHLFPLTSVTSSRQN